MNNHQKEYVLKIAKELSEQISECELAENV